MMEYSGETVDLEVARYALRTFRLFYGEEYEKFGYTIMQHGTGYSINFMCDWCKGDKPLGWTSVSMAGGRWGDGVCEATCLSMPASFLVYPQNKEARHASPDEKCNCGIYGTLNLRALTSQYPGYAKQIVAVIAAEGHTLIGSIGLRTERARVIAYWCPEYLEITKQQFPDAIAYDDLDEMQRAFGFPMPEPPKPPKEEYPPLGWSVTAQKQQAESKKSLLRKLGFK